MRRTAAKRNVLVLLTCHRLRKTYATPEHPANWPGSWDGLWYERDYNGLSAHGYGTLTEHRVAELWANVAGTFCGEWNVFAVDLMNEPHNGYWG
jgi:hypothetical protein